MWCGMCSRLAILSLAILIGITGCAVDGQSRSGSAAELTHALGEVTGTYVWRDDLDRYDYSEKLKLEEIVSDRRQEDVVAALVECLDDPSLSRSLIEGRQVAVGLVCYQALTQQVYYEPTAPDGDIAVEWPGHVSPKATPDEMRAAKGAWRQAANAGLLVFQ
jgi:hypothetical protein